MTDVEDTLSAQLHRLADDLAPDADPADQVGAARSRYRRQRRTRAGLTALAGVTAAIVVGVPAALGTLSADPGDVAGPRSAVPTATAGQSEADERLADLAEARAAREAADAAAQARLAARIGLVSGALADRDPPLELRVSADAGCPDGATALTGALGRTVTAAGAGDLTAGCRWSAPGLRLTLSFTQGQTEDEMVAEVDGDVAIAGCTVQAMPSTVDVTPLTLCPTDGGAADGPTTWTLRVPDSGGAGYWGLSAAELTGAAPDDGAGALLALVDLAAATWGS